MRLPAELAISGRPSRQSGQTGGLVSVSAVPIGSFTRGALVDLDPDDLARMLELNETLFVEHKSDIGSESAYGLASAVASFANTLGGWLLLGVHEGKALEAPPSWTADDSLPLVDLIRDRGLDPAAVDASGRDFH